MYSTGSSTSNSTGAATAGNSPPGASLQSFTTLEQQQAANDRRCDTAQLMTDLVSIRNGLSSAEIGAIRGGGGGGDEGGDMLDSLSRMHGRRNRNGGGRSNIKSKSNSKSNSKRVTTTRRKKGRQVHSNCLSPKTTATAAKRNRGAASPLGMSLSPKTVTVKSGNKNKSRARALGINGRAGRMVVQDKNW